MTRCNVSTYAASTRWLIELTRFVGGRIQFNPGITAWLLDHFIRSRKHVGRNPEANPLRRFEIDDQLELRRLLDWKVGGLGAFQDFVRPKEGWNWE